MASDASQISGVVRRGNLVEWTTLRRRKGRLESGGVRQELLELPEGTDPRDPAAVAALKSACGKIPGRLSVGLPTEHALLRIADLPAAEPDEMAGMVELQVDKFSPLPTEHMVISHEVLERDNGQCRVLIAAVPRNRVDEAGEPFNEAGLQVQRVDVELFGWWRLLQDHGAIAQAGRQIFLLLDKHSTELIVTQNGQPILFRSLGGHEDVGGTDFAAEVTEETLYTFATLESEWGMMHVSALELWHWGEAPEDLTRRLREEGELEVDLRSFEDLPPLSEGIARRMARRTDALNLVPREWFEARAIRRVRRRLLAAAAAIVVLWAAVLAGLYALVNAERARRDRLEASVVRLEEPANEIEQLQKRVRSLEQYRDRTYSALETLREVTVSLPGPVELTSFAYKKEDEIALRGQCPSANPIYNFIEALEQSELFTALDAGDIRTRMRGGRRQSDFQINAYLPGREEE